MTSVGPRERTPGVEGFASYGRETRADMIAKYRRYYGRQKEAAEKALALTDEELIVDTYVGVWAQNGRREVTE
jgi:hypothetical protein